MEELSLLTNDIRAYVGHCRTLLRDIDYVLHDYALTKAEQPFKLYYAVDFSEIFSYALPEETHETAPFPDGWVTGDPLQQYYVLSRFFSRRAIVLAEPHALELRSFFDALVNNAVVYSLTDMEAAVDQLVAILSSPQGHTMVRIAEDAVGRGLSKHEIITATHFYEKYGLILGAALRGMRFQPLERLQRLLKKQPFISIEKLTVAAPPIDTRRVEERLHLLLRWRGESKAMSCHNDAVAVEQLRVANRMLAEKRIALRLVTRGPFMHSLIVREARRADSDGFQPFVRHPRIFSPAYLPAGGLTDEFIKLLQGRRDSIEAFIATVAQVPLERLFDGTTALDPDEQLSRTVSKIRAMMEQIRDDWSRGENLAGSLSSDGELSFNPNESEQSARRLLNFLRQSQELAGSVRARIRTVFREARRGFGVLAVNLQQATPEAAGSILYPIEFQSSSLVDITCELAAHWSVTSTAVHKLYQEASETPSDYDLFLALAVSLGALGRWDVAKRYASLAANQADTDGVSAHEAYFLGALCARKSLAATDSQEDVEQLLRWAIGSIALAARLRRKLDRHAAIDSRYLNEAAVINMWTLRFAKKGPQALQRERQRIAARLSRVLARAPTPKLALQAYNSLTYLYLMPPRDNERAQHYLDALAQRLEATYPSRQEWPAFIADTIVYARFRLRRDADISTLKEWIRELRSIADHVDVVARERDWVHGHVAEIREALSSAEQETEANKTE